MPRGDRSGPQGEGPHTGRGAGLCNGNLTPGFMNTGAGGGGNMGRGGRGRGHGRGRCGGGGGGAGGHGWRHWFHATGLPGWMRQQDIMFPQGQYKPDGEAELLKQQADMLDQSLKRVRERLAAIETSDKNQK